MPAVAPLPRSVMVIEDDFHARTALGYLLRACGYEVVELAGAAGKAAVLAGLGRCCAIIADMHLGAGPTGLALALELSAHAGRRIPTVLVTGSMGSTTAPEAARHGMPLLTKPLEPDCLLGWLETLPDAPLA